MPTEDENINFLYLVLTNSGPPTLDIPTISSALGLNNGATSKRWSRLRSAMEEGKNPGSTAYQFLWLAVKHSDREGKSLDWKDIAAKCNTTPGAAAKRYSRMKKAFEEGKDAPGSVGGTPVKAKGMPSKGQSYSFQNYSFQNYSFQNYTQPRHRHRDPEAKACKRAV
ncbi:hypothetical protein P280DRAFT_475841 [Massarina eburnea CBS 473.64]|uniref:Myb-like DNA-binding domain-containing protein n=1 Tax=Massarina eburnea CBS 473.64 TaxID=1395130 RepID=A0A6A6SEJ2_9PLEO|nr:hypothetical protein P280DRAFT_475841 [Massarina eburnea CBS 473.64]